ncbi:unnamed protein product [Rangifer tarandus platyrhynchus]|uniref:Uncharacterized protein n=1 Tax=Rangifer tarandus platyrhynchus TaxID=3082113 RepID=A0ABN8Y097_RANTA|nr:unnamed protein product [Rangifer tarandus platyrhynchus]
MGRKSCRVRRSLGGTGVPVDIGERLVDSHRWAQPEETQHCRVRRRPEWRFPDQGLVGLPCLLSAEGSVQSEASAQSEMSREQEPGRSTKEVPTADGPSPPGGLVTQAGLAQTRWESLLAPEGRAVERAERLRNGRSGHASPHILQAAGGRSRSRRGLEVPSGVQCAPGGLHTAAVITRHRVPSSDVFHL